MLERRAEAAQGVTVVYDSLAVWFSLLREFSCRAPSFLSKAKGGQMPVKQDTAPLTLLGRRWWDQEALSAEPLFPLKG